MELISFPIRLTRDPYVGNQRKELEATFEQKSRTTGQQTFFVLSLLFDDMGTSSPLFHLTILLCRP